MVAQLLHGVFYLEEDPPRAFEERGAGLGEHGFPPQAVEKLVTNLTFQVYNLLAQAWLRDVATFGGAGKIGGLGHGHEVAELMNFHRKFLLLR
jgi:hypothetical protein